MLNSIKTIVKNSKEIRKKRQEIEAEIFSLEQEENRLLSEWSAMIAYVKKIKIIKSESTNEFEKEYEKTINELNNRERKAGTIQLGDVINIVTSKLECKNNLFLQTIEYKEYQLINENEREVYTKVRKEYDEVVLKRDELIKILEK